MTEHSALPWTWHAKSIDQAHNGSIYRMERPGHAYAIAMQPRYVDDDRFSADAAIIVEAVNSHDTLLRTLQHIASMRALPDDRANRITLVAAIEMARTALSAVKAISNVVSAVGASND